MDWIKANLKCMFNINKYNHEILRDDFSMILNVQLKLPAFKNYSKLKRIKSFSITKSRIRQSALFRHIGLPNMMRGCFCCLGVFRAQTEAKWIH